jgi:hypothetical protein
MNGGLERQTVVKFQLRFHGGSDVVIVVKGDCPVKLMTATGRGYLVYARRAAGVLSKEGNRHEVRRSQIIEGLH